jgi:hypothetical protein
MRFDVTEDAATRRVEAGLSLEHIPGQSSVIRMEGDHVASMAYRSKSASAIASPQPGEQGRAS